MESLVHVKPEGTAVLTGIQLAHFFLLDRRKQIQPRNIPDLRIVSRPSYIKEGRRNIKNLA